MHTMMMMQPMTRAKMPTKALRLAVTLAGSLLPALALAEEAAECNAESFCWKIQGFYIIDFLVFVGILVWAGRKPIAALLDKRHADVAKEIAAARVVRDEAQAKYDEYKQRIDGLEQDLQKMMADVRIGTESEVQRILADAHAQVERMTAEEQLRLAQESKRLRLELQNDAAKIALEMAEATLKQRLDAAGQRKSIDRAAADLAVPQA
jgi:F-type H+-transporting ATPase subunit b